MRISLILHVLMFLADMVNYCTSTTINRASKASFAVPPLLPVPPIELIISPVFQGSIPCIIRQNVAP